MAVYTRRASDVRITEIDLSSSLTGASPSTAAIVMVSAKGPTRPTFYSSADDFRANFGEPDARVSFDHYAALDYFKGGNALWAVRAVGLNEKTSAAMVKLNSSLETVIDPILAGVDDPTAPDFTVGVLAGETALFQITPKNGPGSYGDNISVQIESENVTTPDNLTATTTTLGGFLLSATYEYVVSALGKSGETLASAPVTIVIGALTVTNTVTITWDEVPGAIGYRIYGRAPGTPMYIDQVGGATFSYTDLGAITPDASQLPITSAALLATPSPLYYVKVFDNLYSTTNPVEQFTCSVTEQVDDTGLQMEITQRINPYSRYIRVESNVNTLVSTPVLSSTPRVSLAGGASGSAPTSADINAAWALFEDTSMYQLDILINAGRSSVSVQYAMDALAQKRGDCVAHLDAPQTTNSAQEIVDYRNLTLNLNSSYSMLTCSSALEADIITGKLLYVPMSGLTAALQARVSRTTQPWFSIAGINRGQLGVPDIRLRFNDGEATLLYRNQVSYPRRFAGKGTVWWEANTLLARNSALQFLNIRVLCNILKRSMYDYLLYGLQEPGDDILRKQLQFSLEDYLRTVQSGRGISKFKVVISDVNNSTALANSAILAVAVIITPIIAVREIQLTLAISNESLNITEAEIAAFGG
jgi:hypothetical protein